MGLVRRPRLAADIALWVFGVAAGLVVLGLVGVAIAVATFDVNSLVAPAQARVKTLTGRDLLISGGAKLAVGLQPKLIINEVSISNAPWAGPGPLAAAKRVAVQFELLPLLRGRIKVIRLELIEPAFALVTDAQGRGNWEFGAGAAPATPAPATDTPAATLAGFSVDQLDLTKGSLTYRNGKTGKVTEAAIDALSIVMNGAQEAIHAEFRGKVDAVPIELKGELGALEALVARRWPYPIDVGGDIAGRKATLKALLRVDEHTYAFDPLDLAFAGHVVKGRGSFTTGGARPRLALDASMDSLKVAELPLLGSGATSAPRPPAKASRFLLSETEIPFGALRDADADVKLLIGRVALTNRIDLQQVDARFTIEDGRLDMPVLKARLFGGSLIAHLTVDAAQIANPSIALRATANDMELSPLLAALDIKGEVRGSRAALSADLTTHGISPHAWAADASGSALLTVTRGTLANSKLDFGGALEQLFAALNPFRQKDTSTEILCVVARLPLSQGVARIDRSLAMETDKAGASASGTVDFRSETLDLAFSPRLRQGIKIEALQVAQLVRLQGSLRDPRVNIDAVASATSAARIGAAIGTGGLSVLGEALLHQSTQGGAGPCEVALGKALPESSNTARHAPTNAPQESPARVLPRLRRQ